MPFRGDIPNQERERAGAALKNKPAPWSPGRAQRVLRQVHKSEERLRSQEAERIKAQEELEEARQRFKRLCPIIAQKMRERDERLSLEDLVASERGSTQGPDTRKEAERALAGVVAEVEKGNSKPKGFAGIWYGENGYDDDFPFRDPLQESTTAPKTKEPKGPKLLRGMGAEAPEGTTPEDLERELADALGRVGTFRHQEALEIKEWLPSLKAERVVAVFGMDESGARILKNADSGIIIAREGDESGSIIAWQSLQHSSDVKIVLESEDNGASWAVIDTLGTEDTYKAEVQAYAYEDLETGRIFPAEVRREVEEHKAIGEDELIRREVQRLGLVLPEGRNWQRKYRIGENRIDARGLETVTVDPQTAEDFDDALSVRQLPNGDTEVWVHAASPVDFVRPASASFKEAMRRGTSVYLKGTVIPMLHAFYSGGEDAEGGKYEGVASLVEGKDRVVNSLVFTFRHGKLAGKPFKVMAVINSNKRFSYEEAQKVLDGEAQSPHAQMLKTLARIGQKERKIRERKGQINLPERAEWNIQKTNNGEVLVMKERIEMMKIIEDFMLLANNAQGQRLLEASKKYGPDIPGVFRVHESPSLDEIRDAAVALGDKEFIAEIDQREKGEVVERKIPFENYALLRFLESIELRENSIRNIHQGVARRGGDAAEVERVINSHRETRERAIMPIIMRLISAARISTNPTGHFFLNSPWYTWWSSPMRRASDNIVELLDRTRQYRDQGKNITPFDTAVLKNLEPLLEQISERGLKAKTAEQTSQRMYATEQLVRSVGKKVNARVVNARIRDGETILHVRVQLPRSSYEQDYMLSSEQLDGFPTSVEDLKKLRGDLSVELVAADVGKGTIKIAHPLDGGDRQ